VRVFGLIIILPIDLEKGITGERNEPVCEWSLAHKTGEDLRK
jgi:hypothetical protein